MPNQNPTLLQVVREQLDASVDPDSDGGQILNSLTLVPGCP